MSEQPQEPIWRSLEERDDPQAVQVAGRQEFPEPAVPELTSLGRRDFLRAAGFAFGGAATIGCGRAPVEKAIPYLVKPEEITPGRAYHYASSCGACPTGCGLLVKNRDGRPIKLEGLDEHPLSQGKLCAVGQASILGLYDSRRFQHPLKGNDDTTWAQLDGEISATLERLAADGGAVRLLTGTIHSPTLLSTIETFLARFPNARHVVYDALSSSATADAYEQTHGARVLPHYRFDQARVIVGLDADFLGTWISPVEYTAQWREARRFEDAGSDRAYHAQFEAGLSITGSKADRRYRIAPNETGVVLTHLAARLAKKAGVAFDNSAASPSPIAAEDLDRLADRLWAARGRSLVVCGSQSVGEQVLCNFINHLLAGYGSTVELDRASRQRLGNDRELQELLAEIERGDVQALLIAGRNPMYELPDGSALADQIRKVPLTISFAERSDETSDVCGYVCPTPHYLEAWGDGQPIRSVLTLQQPCIEPFGDTRPLLATLAAWSGDKRTAYELVRDHWRETVLTLNEGGPDFDSSWQQAVHDGFHETPSENAEMQPGFNAAAVQPLPAVSEWAAGQYNLLLYPKAGLLDGSHAYNAWLQELPDPVTKITWDNYACLSPDAAAAAGVTDGDVIRLTPSGGGDPLELPVVRQPGQHDGTIAVALGYGAKVSERFAGTGPQWLERRETVGPDGKVGVNAASWLRLVDGALHPAAVTVTLELTGRTHPLAATQTHHTITVPEHLAPRGAARRPVVQETTLAELASHDSSEGDHHGAHDLSLWRQDHEYTGHRWGMAIDLDACTGCSACVVACQVENNIPVVGKDEVRRRREMHWMRIDRYYEGDDEHLKVSHQPMLCQHCENAPCETVCPVLATVHSDEGLNQQIYNRCVGTRYCANNCPYKVRRFNWFDYAHDDAMENLVLNPDVTVRSRGVMEKCSFCVQRIQESRMEAKRMGIEIEDGAIRTACEQSCPADAIVFGDMNDPASRISHAIEGPRAFQVLEEINVRPSVSYLKVVRDEEGESNG